MTLPFSAMASPIASSDSPTAERRWVRVRSDSTRVLGQPRLTKPTLGRACEGLAGMGSRDRSGRRLYGARIDPSGSRSNRQHQEAPRGRDIAFDTPAGSIGA